MSSLRAQFVQTGKEPKERRGDAHFARHGVVISQIKKTSRRENREGKKKISGSVVEWHHHRISVVVHCWPFQKFCTHPERRRKRRTGAGFRPWAMTRSRSRRRHCLVTFMCDSIPGSFARWISWRQMALATRSLCWRNEWIRCAALGLARLSNLTAMMACWAPLQLSNQCSNGSNSSAVNSRGGCGAITMAAMTATLNTHPKTNKRLKSVSCQTHTHTHDLVISRPNYHYYYDTPVHYLDAGQLSHRLAIWQMAFLHGDLDDKRKQDAAHRLLLSSHV